MGTNTIVQRVGDLPAENLPDLAAVLALGADANNVKMTNLPACTSDTDAANKKYVDDTVAAEATARGTAVSDEATARDTAIVDAVKALCTVLHTPPVSMTTYVTPFIFDDSATTGGLYVWVETTYVQVGVATSWSSRSLPRTPEVMVVNLGRSAVLVLRLQGHG